MANLVGRVGGRSRYKNPGQVVEARQFSALPLPSRKRMNVGAIGWEMRAEAVKG